MAIPITLQCVCGEGVDLQEDAPAKPVRCGKCGSGLALVVMMQRYVWVKGDGWVEADASCEGCGKALLHDQIAWSDSEGVHLCAKCAPTEGRRELERRRR